MPSNRATWSAMFWTEPTAAFQNIVHVPSENKTKHTFPFHRSHPPSNSCITPLKTVSPVRDSPLHSSAHDGERASQPCRPVATKQGSERGTGPTISGASNGRPDSSGTNAQRRPESCTATKRPFSLNQIECMQHRYASLPVTASAAATAQPRRGHTCSSRHTSSKPSWGIRAQSGGGTTGCTSKDGNGICVSVGVVSPRGLSEGLKLEGIQPLKVTTSIVASLMMGKRTLLVLIKRPDGVCFTHCAGAGKSRRYNTHSKRVESPICPGYRLGG